MRGTIHLILIDEHAMVRAGFRMLLEAHLDLAVIGEAGSGAEGLALLGKKRPDLLVMDASLGDISSDELTRQVKARYPWVRVLALALSDGEECLRQMLEAGVDGYLPKRAAADDLVDAVRAVHAGERYVHASLAAQLEQGRPAAPAERPLLRGLTPRQREVLRLVAEGLTSQQVAEALGLSARTVDRHVENMMRRYRLHSRLELVRHALREGLLEEPAGAC